MSIRGKNDVITTFITCYCPVKGTSPGSVYAQHLLYMSNNILQYPNNIVCPRQLFGHDLRIFIEDKLNKQHQIVVSGDFNSCYEDLTNWMLELGLQDLIHEKHGQGPITYERSREDPIDCIFGSPSLKISKNEYLSFGRLQSDHRGIWIDIPHYSIYGFNSPPVLHPNARKLKMRDPRIVEKYLHLLHTAFLKHDMYYRMDEIHSVTMGPLTLQQEEDYEDLINTCEELAKLSEDKCIKLHCG